MTGSSCPMRLALSFTQRAIPRARRSRRSVRSNRNGVISSSGRRRDKTLSIDRSTNVSGSCPISAMATAPKHRKARGSEKSSPTARMTSHPAAMAGVENAAKIVACPPSSRSRNTPSASSINSVTGAYFSMTRNTTDGLTLAAIMGRKTNLARTSRSVVFPLPLVADLTASRGEIMKRSVK